MALPDKTKNPAALLAFEVAFRYFTPEELQTKFKLSLEEYGLITRAPEFQALVAEYAREIDESGTFLRTKARRAVSVLLDDLISIAQSAMTDPKDRIDAVRELARLGHLVTPDANAGGNSFSVQINMGTNVQSIQAMPK